VLADQRSRHEPADYPRRHAACRRGHRVAPRRAGAVRDRPPADRVTRSPHAWTAGNVFPATAPEGAAAIRPQEGRHMSIEENKAIVGRWFAEFWGKSFDPAVIDELAAPDIRFEYSLHAPCRGRDEVRQFATKFRAAFPDLSFWGTADLIAEGDYVVGQWE